MTWVIAHMYFNYSKVYTTADRVISGSQQFPYVIQLGRDSIPWTWTQWCKENCTDLWAWWFNEQSCYIGFMNKEEAMWFVMKFQSDKN